METNRAQWLKNQYRENWSAKVAVDALCKTIDGDGKSRLVRRFRHLNHQRMGSPQC